MKQFFKSDQNKVKKFIETKSFDLFIMTLIFINSIVLGLMASPSFDINFSGILYLIDRLCMAIFLVELGLKLYVYNVDFFKSRWNTFDFFIILISSFSFASSFIIFRAFRLFRLFKYINRFSKLKRIVDVFAALLPNFIAFLMVFSVFLYIFAIIGVNLFSDRFLDFTSLSESTLTLLQVFTLDGWANITRSVMSVFPHSWVFFISFLLCSLLLLISFIMSLVDEVIKKELKPKSAQKEIKKTKKEKHA